MSYLDTFTERDIEILADLSGTDTDGIRIELRRRPWAVHDLLADPGLIDGLFDPRVRLERGVSPFFLFAALLHHASAGLQEAAYVSDWWGPRCRLPVFDVEPLREFAHDPGRIFFLAGLLSSFALPEAPPVPAQRPLDPIDLASWLDATDGPTRVAVLRRLGDLALFHAGVYPDRTGSRPLTPVELDRLGRSAGMEASEILGLVQAAGVTTLAVWEELGARWYAGAVAEGSGSVPAVVSDVAHRFRPARRLLTHLADGYLYRGATGLPLAA